ncbi:MAG: DegT/DnrJ/EryC1/StrS family aminotransferase [Lachnospiraceae bacterium]|nr:DegT/DnrJ/EryC1/StrS family aminotransferase [Lachnospiraceae bacterium]MBP3595261.1 DegT/DnrJ/EryC1/StrS family aminotransferase [Lachnospiraceae bacterium]
MKVMFSPPDIGNEEIIEIGEVLKSGWITTGPKTKEFERIIANYCGTNRAVCLNSATACMELTLRILGVKAGDEVIVPAYTYTATASVVCHVGATPVFVDSANDSLEMDYEKLESLITEKTKVIIPVDLAGIVCDYQKIYDIVEKKKYLFTPETSIQEKFGRIVIMADAAHAYGAYIKDMAGNKVMCGAIADFTSFSFHAVKNLTTAEGGAITWKKNSAISDDELYGQYMLLSLHGQSKDALAKTKLGAWEYDIVAPYYKCNMTDIAAAVGIAQQRKYDSLLMRRKEIIEKYNEQFIPLGIEVLPHYEKDRYSSGHLYITKIPGINEEQRNAIILEMAEREIACNVHYKPLPMMTAYKAYGLDIKDFPNAYMHFAKEITLPLHTCLTNEEIEYVISTYCEIVGRYL